MSNFAEIISFNPKSIFDMKANAPKKKQAADADVKENSFPVVAIGASAGGLEAMLEFLKYLPADTGMAFIYVQHLSPDHKSLLTEILSTKTRMIVQEIDDMDKIKPNNVFIIPYNKGIEVTDGHIKLIPRSETSAAITIDILFSSLAEAQKERVIGIILSGSASDGTIGMKAIKQEGGLTFAQDDSAKFTSMPHSAILAGIVDFILSPKEIALELERLSKHPIIKAIGYQNGEEDLIENNNPDLKLILNLLHNATGVDFSAYKMNTIKRRIIRRMLLYKIATLENYATLLSEKKEEIDILYQDLLINVTSFFRDTDTHKYLKETLFPKLIKRKKNGEPLRMWVPACSTGEEAYSIAMMLLEIQESKSLAIPIQIFATDLSTHAINKARMGTYSKQDLESVSPKRIQRFFLKSDGGFRVNKALRDICVFATHNILNDPPFSRLDFISCCNLFIYFDLPAQKKAVNTFHYALNDDGFLMLGNSENISHSSILFTGFNKKYKIFSRKINTGTRTLPTLQPRTAQQILLEVNSPLTHKTKIKQSFFVNQQGLDHAIDAVLISEFMPASVVINYQLEIVQFRGNTDLFLTHPKGRATFNIMKMARPEIAFELRNAISKVIKTEQLFRKSGIEITAANNDSPNRIMSLEIAPLKIESDEPLLLIVFKEHEQAETFFSNHSSEGKGALLAKDRRIKKLELELAAAQADALEIAQEHEVFTEELQSANEEVVSSNEELQTVNEELETSKEEIESANEELTTTNQELQTRNDMLNEAYEFSEALLSTLHEPMIVLDKNLRVKSANKIFYKRFKVTEQDTEGMMLYDLGNKQWNIPRLRELLENILPKDTQINDFEITHTFQFIGEKTMLLNAKRIIQNMNHEELILLAFSDISEQRVSRTKIEESEQRFRNLVEQTIYPTLILKGENLILELANDPLLKIWNVGKDAIGKPFLEILPEMKNQPYMKMLLDVLHNNKKHFGKEEPAHFIRANGEKETVYFNFSYQPYRENDGTVSGVIVFASDVTEQVLAVHKVKESKIELLLAKDNAEKAVRSKQQFLSNMSHEIRTPLNSILGFTNVLQKTKLNSEQEEFVQAIKSSGNALNLLVNDILDLAKVDAGKMTFEKKPFELQKSLRSIIHSFNLKIKEKNLELVREYDPEIPSILIGDSVRLNQIVLNLISNAVKFTHKGNIKISLKLLKQSNENVTIEFNVSDTGIGIAQDKIKTIFNVFEQAEVGTANSYGGTGLGLAIVKQLIEAQGGRISLKSKLGVGSTFTFVMTFGKTIIELQTPAETIKLDSEIKSINVLVAEDVLLNQMLIKILLSDFGFTYDIVGNGKLAIEKLKTNTYDIILMDLQMPEMNGFETTEYIRFTMKSAIPIIALTADVTTVDVAKCKQFGMNDYISKPINETALYRKMIELVKKK
jgi:two-component system CheB/CheR fusion protein